MEKRPAIETQIAIAVVQNGDSFLVGRRPEGVPLAGYYEFPGGKLQPGETAAAAAQRECREETGLEIEIQHEYPTVVHRYDHGQLRLHFFHGRIVSDRVEAKPPFAWVPRPRLSELAFPPANQAVLEELTTSR